MQLILKSPAKINLFLRIIGKREDGYHELASLMQTISLHDKLCVELATHDQLSCSNPDIPHDHSNLILKAADLFRRKTGLKFGLKAHVEKNIPVQAGLGGGSSNAATTLWGLNQLCGFPAQTSDLMTWSAEIGSDIPFFFSQGTAFCTGRGEFVENQPPLTATSIWIVKPLFGLSTPKVYGALDLNKLNQLNPSFLLQSFKSSSPCYTNDLETSAFSIMPELEMIKLKLLDQGFETALMCGSGSSFFCLGDKMPTNIPNTLIAKANFTNRQAAEWF